MTNSPSTPFFIIGSGRSGTTMLRLMLNRHSCLRVPRESWFIMPLLDQVPTGKVLSDQERALAEQIIGSHARWKDWESSDDALRSAVEEAQGKDLAGLIDLVFRRCAGMHGQRRWGDKTPKYSMYAARMADLFPEGLFIHMIRDARDVYLSMKLANWFEGSLRRICNYWNGTTGPALELRTICPERYLEFHYEQLIADPEGQLRRLCRFLGEEFEPDMLNFYENAGSEIAPWEKSLHSKTQRPPKAMDAGRWARELSAWEILCVEAQSRELMLATGQEPRFGSCWAPVRGLIRCFFRLTNWQIDIRMRIRGRLFPEAQKDPAKSDQ